MINPIVSFIFYIGFAFTTILNDSWFGLGIFYLAGITLLLLNIKYFKPVTKQLRPFFLFFPILIVIYLIISVLFTNSNWELIINTAGFAIAKLLLLVIIMALYLELSKNHNLILALRSLWTKFNLRWKWIEDLFMFLELTLRFYPTFQREWQIIGKSKKALGLSKSIGKWTQLKSIVNDLPGMILQSYRKAENTAQAMEQRGYGNVIPRGVAMPIAFKTIDYILLFAIIIIFSVVISYVTL